MPKTTCVVRALPARTLAAKRFCPSFKNPSKPNFIVSPVKPQRPSRRSTVYFLILAGFIGRLCGLSSVNTYSVSFGPNSMTRLFVGGREISSPRVAICSVSGIEALILRSAFSGHGERMEAIVLVAMIHVLLFVNVRCRDVPCVLPRPQKRLPDFIKMQTKNEYLM